MSTIPIGHIWTAEPGAHDSSELRLAHRPLAQVATGVVALIPLSGVVRVPATVAAWVQLQHPGGSINCVSRLREAANASTVSLPTGRNERRCHG